MASELWDYALGEWALGDPSVFSSLQVFYVTLRSACAANIGATPKDVFSTSAFAGYNQANPDKALEFVKTLDYAGTDGMYIFPKTYEPYYQDPAG